MGIQLAHLRERSISGQWNNFAVFNAKPTIGDHQRVLDSLTEAARQSGLRIDQSALAYQESGRLRFYGDKNLVNYLSERWVPTWTHSIDL